MLRTPHIHVSCSDVAQFRYLGDLLTIHNCLHVEMKGRFNSGNSFYQLGLTLSFLLLSKNVMVKVYKIVILSVLFCGCETWSLMLREEYRLKAFVNWVLREKSGPNVVKKARKLSKELHDLYTTKY